MLLGWKVIYLQSHIHKIKIAEIYFGKLCMCYVLNHTNYFVYMYVVLYGIQTADTVAEWLRRWIANPLGFSRVGSIPASVESFQFFAQDVYNIIILYCFRYKNLSMCAWQLECVHFINDTVAEWLRRWTWNPLGLSRVVSNPASVESLLFCARCLWYLTLLLIQ